MIPYLFEPYNAWDRHTPKKKKHWHEIVEEEQLMARIIAEQQAQQAQQQVQNQAMAAAGAGGVPPYAYFHSELEVVDFSATPLTGAGPLTVVFTNLTTSPEGDSYLWTFGDGETSTEQSPTHLYSVTGSFTASLQVTNSLGQAKIETKNNYISSSVPVVTAAFTYTSESAIAPATVSFVSTTTNTSQTPTTTLLWTLDGNPTTSTSTTVDSIYQSGSHSASLQATGSYNKTSVTHSVITLAAPTLTATFTFTTSSTTAPSTASFTNNTTYNGHGTLTYKWLFGSGSFTSSLQSPSPFFYTAAGGYTASLQVTESSYNIKSALSRSFTLT